MNKTVDTVYPKVLLLLLENEKPPCAGGLQFLAELVCLNECSTVALITQSEIDIFLSQVDNIDWAESLVKGE